MKTKLLNFINSDSLSVLILTLSLIITVVISLQSPSIKAITQHEIITQVNEESSTTKPTIGTITTQIYTITKVTENGEYYGQSSNPNDNVYFTEDYLQSTGKTNVGDTIEVTYEDDDILQVSRIAALTQACELQSEDKTCVIESAL